MELVKPVSIASQYINGGIAGMFGILISHPLDTIKTHIQTGNTLSTFKPTIRNFYRGLSVPLAGIFVEKAIVFGTYNYVNTKTNNIPLSGSIAGLTASLVVTPYERLKILKQNSRTVVLKDINMRFLFKGLSATFSREMPGFAIYFSTYEYLKYHNFTKHDMSISSSHSFMYGGLSGLLAWVFIYPQDKIKTILQSSMGSSNSIKSGVATGLGSVANADFKVGFTFVAKHIYYQYGLKHFYKGFSWAAGRAMLLHSGTFCAIEALNAKDVMDSVY